MKKHLQKKPKISVIISTYNRVEKFLPRALESVKSQTFTDFECIVVDDCSTDKTQRFMEEYTSKDKRFLYVRMTENFGSDTRPKNIALQLSKGDYIAYLDDDCEFHPYHLDVLYKRLLANPELDMVYGDMWIYEEDKPSDPGRQAITLDFDSQFLMRRNFIDTSEVMHKRELAFQVGGFDQTLPKFIDWNMWVRFVKAGAKIQRVPMLITNYYVHKNTKSNRIQTKSWYDPNLQMTMFEPTFSPGGCYIYLPYLGDKNFSEKHPRVGIFTITYDRLEYTKRMYESLKKSTKYPFEWCVFDNGSKDGTADWLTKETDAFCSGATTNKGLTFASNYILDKMKERNYQIIIKVDNDCEFRTFGWLEKIVDLWKKNHMLYMSPYVEGLVDNPGGAPRVGVSYIGKDFIEVTYHIGGICAAIWARAYDKFCWSDKFLHGNQDMEASKAFRGMRFMPCYVPMHRVMHMDSTEGQRKKYPEYFERRKQEKQKQYVEH